MTTNLQTKRLKCKFIVYMKKKWKISQWYAMIWLTNIVTLLLDNKKYYGIESEKKCIEYLKT